MPTYEYRCEACGHRFERFQSMTDGPVKACPECRDEVRRLIGAGAGVLVKGTEPHAVGYRAAPAFPGCGREHPCCGREVPCDKSPRNA